MEMLLCYEDEGVYVNTYGRIIKDVVLQWGEMPTSVGECEAGAQPLAWEWAWAAAHSLPLPPSSCSLHLLQPDNGLGRESH